jgi:hypothetical protein
MGQRQEVVRRVRIALVAAGRPSLDAFLAAQRAAADLIDSERRARLRPYARALIAALHQEVDRHAADMAEANFPVATAKAVLAEMVWGWVESPQPVVTAAAPPELIARFPEVKDLLAPEGPPDGTPRFGPAADAG